MTHDKVVWADTYAVGCGRKVCATVDVHGEIWEDAIYVVCDYGPTGNYRGVKPFLTGDRCLKCPDEAGFCTENSLCRDCTSATDKDSCGECPRTCENCGTLDQDTCTCKCAPGYDGPVCTDSCDDHHEYCGANPGWYGPELCHNYEHEEDVRKFCRKMCSKCEPEDPSFVCDENDNNPPPSDGSGDGTDGNDENPPPSDGSADGTDGNDENPPPSDGDNGDGTDGNDENPPPSDGDSGDGTDGNNENPPPSDSDNGPDDNDNNPPTDDGEKGKPGPTNKPPRYCKTTFTGASVIDGNLFLFKKNRYWRFDAIRNGKLLTSSGGDSVEDLFPGVTPDIKAIYQTMFDNVRIFIGDKYWDYSKKGSGWEMDSGFPRDISSEFPGLKNPNAVVCDGCNRPYASRTYLINKDSYWLYAEHDTVLIPEKFSVSDRFDGIPAKIDGAFMDDKDFIFVKGKDFWRVPSGKKRVSSVEPKPLATEFLGCGE